MQRVKYDGVKDSASMGVNFHNFFFIQPLKSFLMEEWCDTGEKRKKLKVRQRTKERERGGKETETWTTYAKTVGFLSQSEEWYSLKGSAPCRHCTRRAVFNRIQIHWGTNQAGNIQSSSEVSLPSTRLFCHPTNPCLTPPGFTTKTVLPDSLRYGYKSGQAHIIPSVYFSFYSH